MNDIFVVYNSKNSIELDHFFIFEQMLLFALIHHMILLD